MLTCFDPCTTAQPKAQQDRQRFLQMFARAYFPGRSGQLMVVPKKYHIITAESPHYRFMHGTPWEYDVQIPLIFHGGRYVKRGVYKNAASLQDVAPTVAALLGIALPGTTGRILHEAINLENPPPKAVLLLVLDAMRRDYFDRYRERLPHLTQLRESGAWFANAEINYLPSATALAHSTIATGADPMNHGIVGNSFFNWGSGKIEDPFPSLASKNLVALTLADVWNLRTRGGAVIAVQAGAGYAAGGMAGRGKCQLNAAPILVASYSKQTGAWESNPECYVLPPYLKENHSRALWQDSEGTWEGHNVSDAESITRSALFLRFEGESLLALIKNEPVGLDEITDLILVNLKTPDFVGHQYGPFSPEMEATLAELDVQIGKFMEALFQKAGEENVLILVTADHGMPMEPETKTGRHFANDLVRRLHEKFDPEEKLVRYFEPSNSQIFVDRKRAAELALSLTTIRDYLQQLDFIFAVFTEEEVRAAQLSLKP